MKERVRPDDIVDLDETEPAKKAKDLLEKAPYKQLTPSDYFVVSRLPYSILGNAAQTASRATGNGHHGRL